METMREKSSRTLLLEKETEEPSENSFVEEKPEEKKESAKKVLFENNTPELYMENLKKNFAPQPRQEPQQTQSVFPKIQFEAAETFFSKPVEKIEEQEEKQILTPEVETNFEEEVVEEIEPEIEEEHENEIACENEEETQNKRLKRAKPKTRFRIFVFGLVGVVACMCGWAIYNSVEIQTLTSEIEQANKIYSVNVYNYINNLSKTDDLTNPDSIFNLDSLSDAGVVPIQPTNESQVEYSVKSNWFDRLCNWISNLFN